MWEWEFHHSLLPLVTKFGASHSSEARRAVTVMAGLTDPNHQGEVEPLLQNGGKEDYVWNTRHP